MSNPSQMNNSGGGLGQAAGELLKEMQKAQAEMQQLEQREKINLSGGAQFDQLMQQNKPAAGVSGPGQAQGPEGVSPTGRGTLVEALRGQKTDEVPQSTRVGATEKTQESKLQHMLGQLVSGQDKMTHIMNMALSGQQFTPVQLLAMQAGVYRFSQELDLTSKVVQQATSGIKQTLNTQV